MMRMFPGMREQSKTYSDNIRRQVLEHAILPFLMWEKPSLYPEFSEVIQQHFRLKSDQILKQVQEWSSEDAKIPQSLVQRISFKLFHRSKLDRANDPVAQHEAGSKHGGQTTG